MIVTKRTTGDRSSKGFANDAAQQRATASARADAEFLRERKRREAVNREKTLRLRALRLEKEAEEKARVGPVGQKVPRPK